MLITALIYFKTLFLIISESYFPIQYVTNNVSNNHWITPGIKISCKCKKFLHIMSKTTNCSKIKVHYTKYYSVSQKVIRKTKKCTTMNCYLPIQINLKLLRTLLIMKMVLHLIRSLFRMNLNLVTKI